MPNPRNSPGKGLGSHTEKGNKPRVRSGSGKGGGLVPRAADNAPHSGPHKAKKGNPRSSSGKMVSPETKTPQTQRNSGPPSRGGGGSGGGRGGPPARGGGSPGQPQGGGRVPAQRGNTQPANRPGPSPRGTVDGGNLSTGRPPKRPSDILDNLLYDALRNTDSAAGALFRTILRGVAGPVGVAADMASAPGLNKGEAGELAGAKADAVVNRSQIGSGPEAPLQAPQSNGEGGQSSGGGDAPKPDQKPSQGGDSGSGDSGQSQSQGDGGGASLPDDASLGDKIAYGQRNGHPVIEHQGKIYKHDPDSPTGYRFAGRMDSGQGSQEAGVNKSSSGPEGSPADQGGYGMKDFMNDLREGPSKQEAKRIQERFSSRDR